MADKPLLNIADLLLEERGHGTQFLVKCGRIAPMIGLTGLGCLLHVVPPGKRAFPFHAHHVIDEMFVVLSGTGEYRFGDRTYPVRAGDVLAAPAGESAHQLINTGSEELRYLGISTMGSCDIVEYPDSGKFSVAAGIRDADFATATFVHRGHLADTADYWEGEAD